METIRELERNLTEALKAKSDMQSVINTRLLATIAGIQSLIEAAVESVEPLQKSIDMLDADIEKYKAELVGTDFIFINDINAEVELKTPYSPTKPASIQFSNCYFIQ